MPNLSFIKLWYYSSGIVSNYYTLSHMERSMYTCGCMKEIWNKIKHTKGEKINRIRLLSGSQDIDLSTVIHSLSSSIRDSSILKIRELTGNLMENKWELKIHVTFPFFLRKVYSISLVWLCCTSEMFTWKYYITCSCSFAMCYYSKKFQHQSSEEALVL